MPNKIAPLLVFNNKKCSCFKHINTNNGVNWKNTSMKISIQIVSIVVTMAFLSCKKTCSNENGNGAWALEGGTINENYTVSNSSRQNGNYFILSGFDSKSPPNSLSVYFSKEPKMNGKFHVVSFKDDVILSDDQVGIRSNVPASGIYSSTGISDNITWGSASPVDVTLNGGKIKVAIPRMTTIILTPTYLDTVGLKGTISEY